MFKITLVNLDADATQASAEFGRRILGDVASADARVLLERFLTLDPIQNFDADPEIVLETRRRKRLVRLSHHKLYLYNPGNILDSALGLTPEEIIAEMDGSAVAAFTRLFNPEPRSPLLAMNRETAQGPALPLPPRARAVLAAVALGLAAYLVQAFVASASSEAAGKFEPMATARESDNLEGTLAGVYMTGNRPGDHGIVFDAGGALKLFELHSSGAPSLIRDSYRLGRIDGALCALGHQPGGAIWLKTTDTLTYCGETYRRIP